MKLGHHAVDGTKMGADASKHKAMSYGRMGQAEAKLKAEVQKLLQEAERVDVEEDARQKLLTMAAVALYRMRKAIVEPVFGQIKEVRGLRRFALRGLALERAEWRFMAMTHNLLKLFRHRPRKLAVVA